MSNTLRAKRVLAGAAAGALVLSLMPAGAAFADVEAVCENAPEGEFDDVAAGGTHSDNIDCIAAYDITTGKTATTYDPSGSVLRGQMATFLVTTLEVAMQDEFAVPEDTNFTDIAGNTHEDNIKIAEELGITTGVTATTYEPNEFVTRAQMATFVVEMLVEAGVTFDADPPDAFTDDDGSTHEANINILADAGIVSGVGGGEYNPSGLVTRAQMASFIALSAGFLDDEGLWDAPRLLPEPGVGGTSETEAPELISFSVESQTDDTVVAEFTFDEDVALLDETLFKLYEANDPNNPTPADAAEVDEDDERVVRAEFTIDEDDFDAVSVAAVAAAAVEDADDNSNPEGSIGVQAATAAGSLTDAPDLLSVENFREGPGIDPELQVDFVFDEDADLAGVAGDYVLVDVDGETEYVGQDVVDGDGEDVHTVEFLLDDIDDVNDVARGYVEEGTVADVDDVLIVNPLQAAEVSGASATPDLVSITFDEDDDRATFNFDEAVGDAPAFADFFVYDTSGTAVAGTSAARSGTSSVIVQFPADEIDGDTVGAIAEEGAVSEATGEERVNLADEMREATSDETFAAGETAGPDLLTVTVSVSETDLEGDPTEYEAVYTFDEDVDTAGDGTLFRLYVVEDGIQITGDAVPGDVDDTEVTVTFDATAAVFTDNDIEDVDDLVLGTVAAGAAVDEDGDESPEGAVATDTE